MRTPRNPSSRPSPVDVFEYELVQEKAATLSRLGRRAAAALDALKAFDAAPDASQSRDELVDAAGQAWWYYVVQREVCGFRDSEGLLRQLGVPREVRLRMGVFPPRAK
ncbi:DUF6665 family protein [Longimicrobium sp.]|uniref:DUF6665 family protein n=1 Tax=Longimicrobium sp. TaxID=2029185 RepID=UPI002C30ED0E|nr:DUF6665 family protein [Longimicrobium sp.]HSU14427.1 DUF6665 family protein [Longimicrobium sp.]